MNKIIFLDFDGVITTLKSHYKIDFDKVELIKEICDNTGAKIVISSSWRKHNFENTKHYLVNKCNFPYPELLVDQTPDIICKYINEDKYMSTYRGIEIQCYLNDHPNINNYVILDDDSDMLLWHKNKFIKTNTYKGISKSQVNKAIKILNNK